MAAEHGTLYALGEAWLLLQADAALSEAARFQPRVGGFAAALGTAFAAQGGHVSLLTQLGNDPFGHRIAAQLAVRGVDESRLLFTDKAPTSLLFTDTGAFPLSYRQSSAELLYSSEQLPPQLFQPGDVLAFSSACLVDSPMRHTHLAALAAARDAGVLVSFTPKAAPGLWAAPGILAETVRLFLPQADVVFLHEQELPLLFRTDAFRAALWHLLQGHTQLVVLAGVEGVHAFTRAVHAFQAEMVPEPEALTANVLFRLMQHSIGPAQLSKLTDTQLAALLS